MYKKYLLTLFLYASVECQSNKDLYNGQANSDYYNSREQTPRSSRLPSPGDSDYRTYVYNNRRYGTDPARYNPYNPNINQPGGFPYNPINTNPLDNQFNYNLVSINFYLLKGSSKISTKLFVIFLATAMIQNFLFNESVLISRD